MSTGTVIVALAVGAFGCRVRRIVWLALALVFGFAVSAQAIESATVSVSLNPDGSGNLTANSQTNPTSETWSWQECTVAGSGCVPFAVGRSVSTSGAGSGAVFRATANDGPTATSPVWRGNVSAVTPPSVTGRVLANALVAPVSGTWSGGWDGDFNSTQLAACLNGNGTECTTLTRQGFTENCGGGAAVIDPAFKGWYLRVADRRGSTGEVFPTIAYSTPYSGEAWAADATTSVAVVGRIGPAVGPRQSSCGPPPLPTATISRRGVAIVRCLRTCNVVLQALHGSRTASVTEIVPKGKTVTIRLSPYALRRLRRGPATFTLTVLGMLLSKRIVIVA